MSPTLHVTNAASRRLYGPGRVWTIMAAPRVEYGEAGEGCVPVLVPELAWVQAAKSGTMPIEEYRDLYLASLPALWPGLVARQWARKGRPEGLVNVLDGDTLLCCCSRAAAAEDRCHRAWAARALVAAGWRVILDGAEVACPN